MTEAPDFDRIARDVVRDFSGSAGENNVESDAEDVAAALRLIWNARGAALIDPVTNAVDEWVRAGAGTYDELQAVVEQAIKKLDR
jgi:hypothetical protein